MDSDRTSLLELPVQAVLPVERADVITSATERERIRITNPLQHESWTDLLRTHPDAGVFHSAEWLRTMYDTYRHRPCYFVAAQDGKLKGLIGVVEVSSWLTGRRGVSLAFTDECRPLLSSCVSLNDLVGAVQEEGLARKWKYFEMRGVEAMPNAVSPSISFRGHTLDLSLGEEDLFAGFDGQARTGVRKAEKSGVRVEISQSEESTRIFYQLHCMTRKRHGLPPQSYVFFKNLQLHVLSRGMGFVALARHEGFPVAAAVFLHLNKKAVYKFGASDVAWQRLRANNLIMWEAIKWYVRNGYQSLDFGRSGVNDEGLCRFKLGFGPAERRIDYYRYDYSRQAFVAGRDRSNGWHNHLFRLMPKPISRMWGALLYQHLS